MRQPVSDAAQIITAKSICASQVSKLWGQSLDSALLGVSVSRELLTSNALIVILSENMSMHAWPEPRRGFRVPASAGAERLNPTVLVGQWGALASLLVTSLKNG